MRRIVRVIGAIGVSGVLGACAGMPEQAAELEEVRSEYEAIAAVPEVRQHGAVPLYEARKALDRVAEADDPAELDHQVYMARSYLEIAEEVTAAKLAEAQVQQLAQERDRLQVAGREQEVQQLEAELAALEAEQTDRGILVTLQDVLFQTNRATLEPGAERSLSAIAQYLQKHPEREVVIEGHTDASGPEDYNRELSQRRAESVKQALVGRGVPEERIETRGLGESTPVASNENPGGRQLNRRVEVVILNGGS